MKGPKEVFNSITFDKNFLIFVPNLGQKNIQYKKGKSRFVKRKIYIFKCEVFP